MEQILLDRIAAHGPMPFAAFMSLALYHPRHGYYGAGPERTGWRGHFLTSPELDPAFGALWARAFEGIWHACDEPDRFDVVEVGPGEGTFAAAVLGAVDRDFADALRYTLVERVARAEQRQRTTLGEDDRTRWARSLDELGDVQAGCVFANEVLDNLPVHLVELREDRLLEVCVEAAQGAFVLTLRPPSNPELAAFLERAEITPEDGHRYEVSLATESFVARAASLIGRGALIFVDYGIETEALRDRPGGTLLCYSATGVDDEPLDRLGEKDITVHANWTIVRKACERAALGVFGPFAQRDAMRALGSREIDERLRAGHDDAVEEGRGADAVRLLSRRQALSALTDPSGLGGLQVLCATKGIERPAFVGEGTRRDKGAGEPAP